MHMHVPDWDDELFDQRLIEGIVSGDHTAMEMLYERYSRPFFSLAYRMTASKQVSEDLVQVAFLSIWRNRMKYSREFGSAHSWLFSIMHYRIIDYLRRLRTHPAWKETSLHVIDHEEFPHVPDPWEQTWRAEQAALIREAMQRLPKEQREVVELAYFEGLTHEEIAKRCNIPLGTAKSRLRLGLHHLRCALIERELVGV